MPSAYLNNEHELLTRIAEGNEQAFTELFMHHRGKVYTTIRRLTDSHMMAEEILQDVFLKIWIKRKELNSIDDFQAYLHTIARYATYRGLKQLAKDKLKLQAANPENEQTFHLTGENLLQLKQYNGMLKQAIKRLPFKQQQTFILIREEGLKRNEVAARLGVSIETVKYNLEEGTRKIRAYFMAHNELLLAFIISVHLLKD